MKKKFVYRKLKINNQIYYQLYKIVDNDVVLDINETKPGSSVNEFYQGNIKVKNEMDISDLLYTYYRFDGENIIFENDPLVITEIHEKFYKKFHDFDLIPKNEFNVSELKKICNETVLFQEQPMSDVISILKSNLDILDTNISDEQKKRLKHNIILYGPSGFGKKTFAKMIMDNTTVPCAFIELGNDISENLSTLVSSLGASSMGNLKKAEHGIVFIKDNFDLIDEAFSCNENEEEMTYNPFYFLEEVMMKDNVSTVKDGKIIFDLSKITYVLIKDTPSNNPENLLDDGMSQNLYDQFQEIICFNRLSKEQIKEVVLNDLQNSFNVYQQICKQLGKELIIEEDFLDYLIKKAYYGIGGISLINNYIEAMIKVRWNDKKIILNKEAVDKEVEDSSYLQEFIMEQEDRNDVSENSEGEEVLENDNQIHNQEEPFKIDLNKIRKDYREKLVTLMEYVKGQDKPLKNILFHAILNDAFQNSNLPPDAKKERISHMLIRGGTGTGKSFITSLVAKQLNNKPYTVVDCKRYTEAGFVGKSVDDILIQLYYIAGGDLEKAQKGTVVLDEFDKLARSGRNDDVSRGAVQESLLKMLEGAVFDLEIKEKGHSKIINFDTRETTFIGAGAFEGLDKIREARIKKGAKKSGIGFHSENKEENMFVDTNYTLEDMQEFGMDAQLLRRMSFHCDLNKLTEDNYKDIMLNAKSSPFKIKCEFIELLGIKITYDEEFVNEFIKVVSKLGFGVSGIAILTARIFAEFETTLLEKDYEEVIFTKECVNDPTKVILIEKENEKVLKKQI